MSGDVDDQPSLSRKSKVAAIWEKFPNNAVHFFRVRPIFRFATFWAKYKRSDFGVLVASQVGDCGGNGALVPWWRFDTSGRSPALVKMVLTLVPFDKNGSSLSDNSGGST